MLKLIMTKGLPASGKSTWAKEQVRKSGGQTKRVNKDDLRDMIDDGKWSKTNEKNILQVRDSLIKHYLTSGFSVIVDDTNLAPKHEETLRQLADDYRAVFEVKSFLDVSLKTCITHDLERPKSVGERVIRGMFDQWLAEPKTPPAVYTPPEGKPRAILCDIDGTLAHGIGVTRKPYEWDKVGTDTIDPTILRILDMYKRDFEIVLLSGRDGSCGKQTWQWLEKHGVPFHKLIMRSAGDTRKDYVVKRELFDQHIRDNYQVEFVLDDRDQVVQMWRNGIGLKVLQVAEGNF